MPAGKHGKESHQKRPTVDHGKSNPGHETKTHEFQPIHEVSLGSDFSQATFERHAALIGDNRISHPMYAQRRADIVLQLQRDYGNRYVQRLVSHIARKRKSEVEVKTPSQQETSPARQRENNTGDSISTNSDPNLIARFPVEVEARGQAHRMRGGTSMTAKVGAESEWTYGSGPPGRVPNLLTKVGHFMQGRQRYIAGHLLNDNMGGLGVNNNLTVLSSDGNKAHTGIEGKVKKLAQQADQINDGSNTHGDPSYDHGARYSVQVQAPNPGRVKFSAQESYIGGGLTIDIDPIRIDRATGFESPWPEEIGGENDLTGYDVTNVPPYPNVPKKKKPTKIQRYIIEAIVRLRDPGGSTAKQIVGYITANINNPPTKKGVLLALKRGVSTKFFYHRGGYFKVIAKNI